MSNQVFKSGNEIGKDKVRVHVGGNRIDGVSKDNELFYNDLPIPKRSKINLSFDRKLSFNMGQLIPILAQECVPGDTFHIAQAHNLMFAPLVSPVFQRIDYRTYYFFVPNRLVCDGWKDFITMANPNTVLPYTTPAQLKALELQVGYSKIASKNSLCDYFDLPVQESNFGSNYRHINVFPFRAYNLIWNEFFRDEFKQSEVTIYKTNNQITQSEGLTYMPKMIGWEKDYFTTCQTSPQVGADVPIPVGNISSDGNLKLSKGASTNVLKDTIYSYDSDPSGTTFGKALKVSDSSGASPTGNPYSYQSGLSITAGTINDLRVANHLQELRDMFKIGGQRYNEEILAEFGVVVPDYRIQRPEYIGGFASPVEIGRVMQTSESATTPLGTYCGTGTGSGRMDYIHYTALEHGYIIGLSVVIPRTSYDQGIPRSFIKDSIFDYYHPHLATLGDEQVYNDEIYITDNQSTQQPDNTRFGYQQRYASYKYALDRINGEFRDNLSFWHMSREFSQAPALNGSFVESNPTDRIFATQSLANTIYAEIYQQIDSVRPMPIAVTPNLTNVE